VPDSDSRAGPGGQPAGGALIRDFFDVSCSESCLQVILEGLRAPGPGFNSVEFRLQVELELDTGTAAANTSELPLMITHRDWHCQWPGMPIPLHCQWH
jgi:hypothetical protein